MATYYWVGGTGTWNNSNTLNWSNVSGGSSGFGPPTSADTVIFDNGSAPGSTNWTVTVASTATSASTTVEESNATSKYYFTMSLSGNPTLTTSGAFTFKYGNLSLNNNTLTVNSFRLDHTPSSIETGQVDFGTSGKIVCTAYSGTPFSNTTSYMSISGSVRRVEIYVPSASQTSNFVCTGASTVGLYATYGPSSSSTGKIIVSSSSKLAGLSLPNNAYTFEYSTLSVSGNLTIAGTSPTLTTTGVGPYILFDDELPSSSGDTYDIATNGKTIPSGLIFNGPNRNFRLLGNLTNTGLISLDIGTLNINGYTFQGRNFNSSSLVNVRTLTFGAGGKISLIADPTVDRDIFDTRNSTNFTVTDQANSLIEISAPTSPRTFSVYPGNLSDTNTLNFKTIANTSGFNNGFIRFYSNSTGGTISVRDLTLYNSNYSFQTNGNLYVNGDFTIEGNSVGLGFNTSYTLYLGTTNASEPNNVITTAGLTLNTNVTVIGNNSITRGTTLGSDLTLNSARTFTLQSGRLDLNNFSLKLARFSSDNSNNRNVDFKSTGNVYFLYPTIDQTFTVTNSTNLAVYGSNPVIKVEAPDTGNTTTITGGSSGVTGYLSTFSVETIPFTSGIGGGTLAISNSIRSLTLYDGSYTFSMASSKTLYGNFTLPNTNVSLTLPSSTNNITFKLGNGNNTINTNNYTIPFNIVVDGSNSCVLNSNLVSTRTLTLTSGTFNANGYDVTLSTFSSNNSNTRTLNLGNGTWTLTGGGTVWNILTGTNLTLNVGGSTIVLNHGFITLMAFYGGGKSYGPVILDGASTETQIYGSNTFSSLSSLKSFSNSLLFEAGTTNTFGNFSVSGTGPGVVVTLGSLTSAIFYMIKSGGGTVNLDYMDISYSYVAPSATWYAGANSVNSGNNNGWVGFPGPTISSSGFMVFF